VVTRASAAAIDLSGTAAEPKRITILGATGSVGTSTLSVIAEQPHAYAVEAVTAGSDAAKLARVARSVGARLAVIADPAGYGDLKSALAGTGIAVAAGADAVEDAAARRVDLVVAAIVGAAGLAPTYAAIRAGSGVAIANKECLVSAGRVFMRAASEAGVRILPVDSEHNAIFQALGNRPIEEVERIVITASGGPFRQWTVERMAKASPAEALKHPNWTMGRKITIDSATLMNKGLEVIEAHYLFGAEPQALEVVVHPQSVVHGLVAFRDGTMIAGMSLPDMRLPIAHCLAWPNAAALAGKRLELAALGSLTFETPDFGRFPALRIAREALETGGWATNVLSAANEIAVEAFLAGRIGFLEIAGMVEQTIARVAAGSRPQTPESVAAAIALDREARRVAADFIKTRIGRP
jgi:1-deoxy-D-xylulose-5-phosphate reductoisomerase